MLPVGISFYTFQNITFIVDAYKGKVKEQNFFRYGLFVSFFPHLIAGPIVHHADIMPQFDRLERNSKLDDFAAGVCLFVIGLAKKTMIADPLGALASPMFDAAAAGTAPSLFSAWIGVLAYTFQIYFDFSAYSDMAYGLGADVRHPAAGQLLLALQVGSIVEFWRRWHMTLSRLLRDYVYIPLGGNRRGPAWRSVNLLATMLIGGLWHGAGWTFILWGGLHGLYLIVNHAWNSLFGSSVRLGPLRATADLPGSRRRLGAVQGARPRHDARPSTLRCSGSARSRCHSKWRTSCVTSASIYLPWELGFTPRTTVATTTSASPVLIDLGALVAFLAPNSIQIMAPSRPVLVRRAPAR